MFLIFFSNSRLAQSLLTQPQILAKLAEVLIPQGNPFGLPFPGEHIVPTSSAALTLGAPPPNLMALQQSLPPGFPNQQLGLPNLSGLNQAQLMNVQNAQNMLQLQQRAAQLQALQGNPNAQRNLLMLGNPLLNPFALQHGVNPMLNDLQAAAAAQQQAMLNEAAQSPEKKILELSGGNSGINNSGDVERARLREKEKERESKERRRMGLPPVRIGFTISMFYNNELRFCMILQEELKNFQKKRDFWMISILILKIIKSFEVFFV